MARKLGLVPASPVSALANLVEDFLHQKRAQGVSPKTLTQYGYALRNVFLPYCAEAGITEPSQLSDRVLTALTNRLLERGTEGLTKASRGPLSKDSVHSYLRPLRWFVTWANGEGAASIPGRVTLPQLPRQRLKEVLDPAEMKAMAEAARARNSRRDELVIGLLMRPGIRVGELIRLRPSDLIRSPQGYHLKVRGKGDKERHVPLEPTTVRSLEQLAALQRRRPDGPPAGLDDQGRSEERIFGTLRRSRRTGNYEPLTISGVEQLVAAIGIEAGIRRRVHPHLLRHSFAKDFRSKVRDDVTLARILGHADLTMIMRHYGNVDDADTYRAMLDYLKK